MPSCCFSLPGSGGLLPIVLCGDFNSTPNSPLVDFITSSFLNYSKMSATEVAGYHEKKGQSRVIPSPLLPLSMNIGPNCMYVESETVDPTAVNAPPTANGIAESAAGGGSVKNHVMSKKEKRTPQSSTAINSSCQEEKRSREKAAAPLVVASGAGDFIQSQNESFNADSSNGLSSKGYSKTRSARGAKARGMSYSGVKMSNFPSLTGAKPLKDSSPASDSHSVPQSSSLELQTPGDTKAQNLFFDAEGDVSTEDSDMECEQGSSQEEQKSNAVNNTLTKAKIKRQSNSSADVPCKSEPRKRLLQSNIHGLITHPFKFVTAYPQSRISTPSTVTTFHQSAFETVDYIFFTPPTKNRAGFHLLSRKALPSTHVLLDLGPQPHRFLSSDHLLLQACFQLVNRKPSRTK